RTAGRVAPGRARRLTPAPVPRRLAGASAGKLATAAAPTAASLPRRGGAAPPLLGEQGQGAHLYALARRRVRGRGGVVERGVGGEACPPPVGVVALQEQRRAGVHVRD